uniref:Putative fimbrial protein. partially(N-terminal) similar to the PilA in Pseudomonas aeruginosa n=1 Tax=Magnetococcus massalia (strain MO-1) TaxID=451514 RepID=A0A1S7LKC4_MAGMO|nr:putative fimbrial protein. partially(N-terminal) similar to the PilA in Pseudomonas aeruginosa [Candidatus Magnetococcus massalia]
MSHIEKKQSESGFTLIEIAIVVVIIGLLLGGILKGQELIRNARAHNIADQGSSVKAAVLGFQDRYRAMPGDYSAADQNIVNADSLPNCGSTDITDGNGDGNGRIGGADTTSGETAAANDDCTRANELALSWAHLSMAGFLSGTYDGDATNVSETNFHCQPDTCLTNAFTGGLLLMNTAQQYSNTTDDQGAEATGAAGDVAEDGSSNQSTTGRYIPVEIIAELDRKVDDGNPARGGFRIADFFVTGAGATDGGTSNCFGETGGLVDHWNIKGQNVDCAAIYRF